MANSTFPDSIVGAGDGTIDMNVNSRPHSLQFNLNVVDSRPHSLQFNLNVVDSLQFNLNVVDSRPHSLQFNLNVVDSRPHSPQSMELGFGIIDLIERFNLNVDPSPPSPQSMELGFGIIDLIERFNSNVDHRFLSPQSTELKFDGIINMGESDGIIDLNVDPNCGSPPGRTAELKFDGIINLGESYGIIDLNVDPNCGSPPRRTAELGFDRIIYSEELDGIIDLNVEPNCGSPPRSAERFDLNAEPSDADSNFFVDDYREGVADEYDEPYDVLPSWQFADDEFAFNGIPPSPPLPPSMANSVVESLPAVFLPQEEITEHNVDSTEGIDLGWQETERFPCSHQYQKGIVLWLRVCNRCALCGHELPMDDLEYEQSREQRGW